MGENLDPDPHALHRRMLARPRQFGRGILLSLGVHLGIAVVLVGVWALLPGPPMRPVRITTYRNPPSRQDLGLLPDGRRPPGWNPPVELAK